MLAQFGAQRLVFVSIRQENLHTGCRSGWLLRHRVVGHAAKHVFSHVAQLIEERNALSFVYGVLYFECGIEEFRLGKAEPALPRQLRDSVLEIFLQPVAGCSAAFRLDLSARDQAKNLLQALPFAMQARQVYSQPPELVTRLAKRSGARWPRRQSCAHDVANTRSGGGYPSKGKSRSAVCTTEKLQIRLCVLYYQLQFTGLKPPRR